MNGLPVYLLDKILFKLDPKSLWKLRCTNRSMQSRIYDPWFESKYISQIPSNLLQMSLHGSAFLSYQPYDDSRPVRITDTITECQIWGSCSGLFLLFMNNALCVVNPLTKKFRFLMSMRHTRVCTPTIISRLGFAVNQIDLTTRGFKLIYLIFRKTGGYKFEIYSGNSWRQSKTKITCYSRNLSRLMRTSVYVDGSLHWLRDDGSIVAFNPEKEEARLIPVKFPPELHSKTLFAADASNLTLISPTVKGVYGYALKDVLSDPKWLLVKQIKNELINVKWLGYWTVEAYDGKCLMLIDWRIVDGNHCRVFHVYDLIANKWIARGSIPVWADVTKGFVPFTFTPSSYPVVGLSDEKLACEGIRISSISPIMGFIDGVSSETVEKCLRKRSLEANKKKVASLRKMKTS